MVHKCKVCGKKLTQTAQGPECDYCLVEMLERRYEGRVIFLVAPALRSSLARS